MAHGETRTKLTYEDLLLYPEGDGLRHEIIDGEHYVSASPNRRHQRIAGELYAQLRRQLVDTGRGEVYFAPLDVVFSQHDVVVPDLLVVLNENAGVLRDAGVAGAPDLVVEILSPSTSKRDLTLKRKLYESTGVPEYWIVDPVAQVVHQHVAKGGRYRSSGPHAERVFAGTIAGLVIDLARVW